MLDELQKVKKCLTFMAVSSSLLDFGGDGVKMGEQYEDFRGAGGRS